MATAEAIDGIPRASPESRGVHSSRILEFLQDVQAKNVDFNSSTLYCGGAVVSEGWWYPYQPQLRHLMHSATKSFLSVAVGMAIRDNQDPKLAALTVEDLLTQTSGHEPKERGRLQMLPEYTGMMRTVLYSTSTSAVGELLDDAKTREILAQVLPQEVVKSCETPALRPYTLATISKHTPTIGEKELRKNAAWLEKLPILRIETE